MPICSLGCQFALSEANSLFHARRDSSGASPALAGVRLGEPGVLRVVVSLCTPSTCICHHTLLSLPLPLSLTCFKHLQRTSLSLYALQALGKSPHPSPRSLSLSLTYFEHLQHISLSLSLYIYIYILQAMTTHHTLLSLPLPLSLTYFKLLQLTSLSLHALQALDKSPHPSSRSLQHNSSTYSTSLSLSELHAPSNHHTPPLAPSRSFLLPVTYRCRGAADSGHAASACDVHHKTQQTRH